MWLYIIFIFLQIMLMKEGGTFTEPIAHAFIYVSFYMYQKGTSTARSRIGGKVYEKRHDVVLVYIVYELSISMRSLRCVYLIVLFCFFD